VSRFSYITAVASEVVEYFQRSAIDFSTDIWFEYSNIPLRRYILFFCRLIVCVHPFSYFSDIPMGVLHDLYLGRGKFSNPWKIKVHFQSYPRNVLNKSSTVFELEKIFFHSIKQSIFLLYGTTMMFNDLNVEQQRNIWKAANTGERRLYEPVMKTIRPHKEAIKLLPVRLIQRHSPVITQKPVKVFADSSMTSLQGVVSSIKRERTLREILLEDFKQQVDFSNISASIVSVSVNNTNISGSMNSGGISSGKDIMHTNTMITQLSSAFTQQTTLVSDITTTSNTTQETHQIQSIPQQYMCQGVVVSPDFPIYDLWCLMAHADLYLYISCI
jgi:hypothetical protein